jgi:hypothetical protein
LGERVNANPWPKLSWLTKVEVGLSAQRIYQDLVEENGFTAYDALFQLTPIGDAGGLRSARIEHGEIALTFSNRNSSGTIKKFAHYYAASGTLKGDALNLSDL